MERATGIEPHKRVGPEAGVLIRIIVNRRESYSSTDQSFPSSPNSWNPSKQRKFQNSPTYDFSVRPMRPVIIVASSLTSTGFGTNI